MKYKYYKHYPEGKKYPIIFSVDDSRLPFATVIQTCEKNTIPTNPLWLAHNCEEGNVFPAPVIWLERGCILVENLNEINRLNRKRLLMGI